MTELTSENVDAYAERYRLVMEKAALAKSKADACDELRKLLKAALIKEYQEQGMAFGASDEKAKAHERYVELTHEMLPHREEANILGARSKAMEMRVDVWRTRQADARKEWNASHLR